MWCVTQTVPTTRISVRWICPSRAVLQPSPGHVAKRTPLGSSPVATRQLFHRAVPSVIPILESRTTLVCLVPLHRGSCVFLQGQAALPRSVRLGGEAGLQTLGGGSCGGSGQGQLPFCKEPDQGAPQFLSHVHSNRTDAVLCGCGRAVSFSRQVFKQRHYHSFALVSFICVSAGWLAQVCVCCDCWGGLWRQTSLFCVFFFSRVTCAVFHLCPTLFFVRE